MSTHYLSLWCKVSKKSLERISKFIVTQIQTQNWDEIYQNRNFLEPHSHHFGLLSIPDYGTVSIISLECTPRNKVMQFQAQKWNQICPFVPNQIKMFWKISFICNYFFLRGYSSIFNKVQKSNTYRRTFTSGRPMIMSPSTSKSFDLKIIQKNAA